MKKILPVVALILFISASCKKLAEKKQEEIVLEAMTTGVWIVEQYFENSVNITSDFLNYEFRFFRDGTVTGTLADTVTNGTWEGNVSNYTITSQFPTASDPVKKLNGVWNLKDSYLDYVEAEMPTASGKNELHLRKKP